MNRLSSWRKSARQRGSALLAALCFAAVLSLALGSYVAVCHTSLQMSSRTMHYTRSIELAEMGLEQAIWSLNKNDWTGWTVASDTAQMTISGISYENGATGEVDLSITDFDNSSGARTIHSDGVMHLPDGTTLTRSVSTKPKSAAFFTNAIAAVGTSSSTDGVVKFNSGGTVDSYDSSRGDYPTQTPGYSAIVAGNAVTLTNAQIKGYVATSSGTVTYCSSGMVIGPNTAAGVKIDPSRLSSTPYQCAFDIVTPTGAGTLLPSGTATVGSPSDTTPRIYYATNARIYNATTLTVDGPVILVVSGYFNIEDTSTVIVTTNGSLAIYFSGDLLINGNGIRNDTKLPKRVALFGSSTDDLNLDFGPTLPFYGVIDTPGGSLTLRNNVTIYGAIVAKNVTFSGTAPVVHYDLDLRNAVFPGLQTPAMISGWQEVTN